MNRAEDRVREIVRRYRDGLRRIFGDRLVEVRLYGSWARGEGRAGESDIDVLCVLRAPFDYWQAIQDTSELTAGLSLEHDVVLSSVFVTQEEFQSGSRLFFRNVRQESVAV